MRYLLILLMLAASPAFAQEPAKPEPAKPEPAKPDAPKPERQMTAEGQKLFEDAKRVYTKYYDLVLAKTKAGEGYKVEDLWETAVKEAKNTAYKDYKEFSEAVLKMKKDDRVFNKEFNDFLTKIAKEHSDAVTKWNEEKSR